MSRKTINSLQAGRGIAAVAVICHHSALAGHDFGGAFAGYTPLSFGYLGVDFFFALSGFIIYHSTVDRGRTLREYFVARFRRVYIPYWPIGIGMALAYTALPTLSAASHTWGWLPSLTLAPVDARPALNVAWTLQHEVLFYVLFGLFYFSGLLWLGLLAWALAIIGGLPHVPFERVNLEFFFGIGAAILYQRREAHWALMILVVPLLLLWVGLGASEGDRVIVGLAFAIWIAPLAQLERDHFQVPGWLITLGAASYSLYLVHQPLISLVARAAHNSWTIVVISMVVSVAGGFAYHFIVERRAVRMRFNPEVFQGASETRPKC